MRASRLLLCVLASAIAGPLITAAVTFSSLYLADQGTWHGLGTLVRHGTQLWLVTLHGRFGLTWVNLELLDPPLVNPVPDHSDAPQWALPPERTWPANGSVRVATLGAGWPLPAVTRQWWVAMFTQTFPLSYEEDESGMSVRAAAERFWEPEHNGADGRTAAGPIQVEWTGAAVDSALFGGACLVGLTLAAAVAGRKRPSPPEGAAGPAEPG
ncbi:MAG: hypothetical protein U0574_12445 [Phycisphaerales bacterium]